MNELLIDLHYLPGVQYFVLLEKFETIFLEKEEHYQKQTLRNRCLIKGSNKVQLLTVPVKKPSAKVSVTDVRIDYSQRWISNHIRSMRSAYANAPYFEFYAEDIFSILQNRNEWLFEMNLQLLNRCMQLLGLEKKISCTQKYDPEPAAGRVDMRDVFDPRTGQTSRIRLDHGHYYQVFGGAFIKNLSIVDLLFCEGPNAVEIVRGGSVRLNDTKD